MSNIEVYNSRSVDNSSSVHNSRYVDNSISVHNSRSVHNSSSVYNSRSVHNSSSVYNSRSVDNSRYVDNSSLVCNSRYVRFLYGAIFCNDIGYKEYVAFNKEVEKKRFEELYSKINSIMQPKLQMKMNLFEDEWKENVTTEQWKELAQIPEFDRDVVEKIVGFTLPLDEREEVEELTMEQLCKELGRTVKIKK